MEALNKSLGKGKVPNQGACPAKKSYRKIKFWGWGKGFSVAIFGDIAYDFGLGLNPLPPSYGKNIF